MENYAIILKVLILSWPKIKWDQLKIFSFQMTLRTLNSVHIYIYTHKHMHQIDNLLLWRSQLKLKQWLTIPGMFPTNILLFNLLAGVSLSCSSLSKRLSRLGRAGEKASGASSSISSSGEDSWSPEFKTLNPISGSDTLDSNSLHFLGDGVRHNLNR